MSSIEIMTPDSEWSPSPTGVPGCAGKFIFRYGSERLGSHGRSGPYTVIYRFDPGASYLPILILEHPCELGVMSGTLLINDTAVMQGSWAQIMPDETKPIALSSTTGCELIAIVRGSIRLVDSGKAN